MNAAGVYREMSVEVAGKPVRVLVNARPYHVTTLLDELRADGLIGKAIPNIITVKERSGTSYTWKAIEATRAHLTAELSFSTGFVLSHEQGCIDNMIRPHPDRDMFTGGPREIAYARIKGRDVEIIKNPTRSDIRQMRAESAESLQCPDTPDLIRYHMHSGNVYAWKAATARHREMIGIFGAGFGKWFDELRA